MITKKIRIIFSNHALKDKFPLLEKHGFSLTQQDIINTISNPDNIDKTSDSPNIISSKSFDTKHILRVVHNNENDIIKVITFYPAEKGRYY
jgi:uncharacterized DUF497 family protein